MFRPDDTNEMHDLSHAPSSDLQKHAKCVNIKLVSSQFKVTKG